MIDDDYITALITGMLIAFALMLTGCAVYLLGYKIGFQEGQKTVIESSVSIKSGWKIKEGSSGMG